VGGRRDLVPPLSKGRAGGVAEVFEFYFQGEDRWGCRGVRVLLPRGGQVGLPRYKLYIPHPRPNSGKPPLPPPWKGGERAFT